MDFFKKVFYLLLIAAFVIAVHAGFMFSKPYIKYKMFKSDAEDVMRFNLKDEQDLRVKLLEVMLNRRIPFKYSDKIDRENIHKFIGLDEIKEVRVWYDDSDRLVAKIQYAETVDYYGFYKKTFKYDFTLRQ